MWADYRKAFFLTVLVSLPALSAEAHYTYDTPSRDGIGKFYFGREISHVMGHLGAGWLERPTREQEERTDLLLGSLDLEPDDIVADLGAGTGYFSFPMARLVPQGKVLAVDIQPEMIAILERRKVDLDVHNVETVLATETNPGLPSPVDAVLLVDAYHEFSHPREVMQSVASALAADGRVVLVEYRGNDRSVPIKPLHKMTVTQATLEMNAIGLVLAEVKDDLPLQHIMIFRKTAP